MPRSVEDRLKVLERDQHRLTRVRKDLTEALDQHRKIEDFTERLYTLEYQIQSAVDIEQLHLIVVQLGERIAALEAKARRDGENKK